MGADYRWSHTDADDRLVVDNRMVPLPGAAWKSATLDDPADAICVAGCKPARLSGSDAPRVGDQRRLRKSGACMRPLRRRCCRTGVESYFDPQSRDEAAGGYPANAG